MTAEHWRSELAEVLGDTATEWGASRFGEWHRCRRAHSLRYVDGIVSLGERPTHFGVGSVVHAAINFLQRGVMAGETTPRPWELVVEAAGSSFPPEVCDEAWRLLDAYWAHYGTANAGWPEGAEILGAELMMSDDATFALPYTARADTVLKLPSGEIVIPDTKTRRASLPQDRLEREEYARGLATRPQFLGLSWLAMRHFQLEEPPHVWVNAIIKTKLPRFDRLLVRITHDALARWQHDHANEAAALKRELASGGEAVANRSACAPDIGSRCAYFDWCHGPEEMREKRYAKGA